jgi:hypothetical protein
MGLRRLCRWLPSSALHYFAPFVRLLKYLQVLVAIAAIESGSLTNRKFAMGSEFAPGLIAV